MRAVFLGHSAFWLVDDRGVRVLIDPFPAALGIPFPPTEADVVVVTHDHFDHNATGQIPRPWLWVPGPDPTEARGIVFTFHPSHHDDVGGIRAGGNQIVCWEMDGVRLCHLGDLGHLLGPDQAHALHGPDVLFVPVGGHTTIDAARAGKVVAQLEPRVIVPMHHFEPGKKMQLDPVEPFCVGRECTVGASLDLLPETLPARRTVALLERAAGAPR